jgi:hypothetical protein
MLFIDLVPDANVLLAMPEQELAFVVLRVAATLRDDHRSHPTSIHIMAGPQAGRDGPNYPQGLRPQIEQDRRGHQLAHSPGPATAGQRRPERLDALQSASATTADGREFS